jgi:SAM-dependent methyltransferase
MQDSFEKQQRYYELGESYFWLAAHYDSVKRLAEPLLEAGKEQGRITILDVGCGCGNLINYLVRWGKVVGLDASADALTFCQTKSSVKVVQASVENIPFAGNTFDFIFAIQTIEHAEDDGRAMRQLYNILKPNGFLIVTVPAFMFLWGFHDEKYGHFRRYTKSGFGQLSSDAGFIILKLRYLNFFPVLPLYIIRRFKRIAQQNADDFYRVGDFLNFCLYKFLVFENQLESMADFPLGTFLTAVLQKR